MSDQPPWQPPTKPQMVRCRCRECLAVDPNGQLLSAAEQKAHRQKGLSALSGSSGQRPLQVSVNLRPHRVLPNLHQRPQQPPTPTPASSPFVPGPLVLTPQPAPIDSNDDVDMVDQHPAEASSVYHSISSPQQSGNELLASPESTGPPVHLHSPHRCQSATPHQEPETLTNEATLQSPAGLVFSVSESAATDAVLSGAPSSSHSHPSEPLPFSSPPSPSDTSCSTIDQDVPQHSGSLQDSPSSFWAPLTGGIDDEHSASSHHTSLPGDVDIGEDPLDNGSEPAPLVVDTDGQHSFPVPPPQPSPAEIFEDAHVNWFVRLLLVVISFLHYSYHLPFTACNLLLFTLATILNSLQVLDPEPMPISLITTLKRLDIRDHFNVLPLCPLCHQIFFDDINDPLNFTCPRCDEHVFRPPKTDLFFDIRTLFGKKRKPKEPIPQVVLPFQPITTALSEFLDREGMIEKMDAWRFTPRSEDTFRDIMDGRIWHEVKGPDGLPFFGHHAYQDEIRIGLTLHLDWFQAFRHLKAGTHSTGALSISIANLDVSERYDINNLLVPLLTPGPEEPNAEQTQEYLNPLTDDLLGLYLDGMDVHKSGKFVYSILARITINACSETDRRARVMVVLVICDHPAMCKVCGFADKTHTVTPCTKCDVPQDELFSEASLRGDYEDRTSDNFKQKAAQWLELSDEDRLQHFKEYGVRWFAFAKLPYFDPIRMTVIDPMHNLLLGVVKTQWYNCWILNQRALRAGTARRRRELDDIHNLLRDAEFPPWLGRLPTFIGEPKGGSLSADEWKTLVIAFGSVALPIVWEDWEEESANDYEKALRKWMKDHGPSNAVTDEAMNYITEVQTYTKELKAFEMAMRKQVKGKARANVPMLTEADRPQPPVLPPDADFDTPPPTPRLQPGEMRNFLHLATALILLLGRTITQTQLMYGEEAVKPNHHYAIHVPPQVEDFGTVYAFWAFLQERLNKVLKTFKTNNHGGGELEVTLMRSFSAAISLRRLVLYMKSFSSNDQVQNEVIQAVAHRLLGDETIARGTVEVLARSSDQEDAQTTRSEGPSRPEVVDDATLFHLLNHFNRTRTADNWLYLPTHATAPCHATLLHPKLDVLAYAVRDGRRIVPVVDGRGTVSAKASIVEVRMPDGSGSSVAELLRIYRPAQSGLPKDLLAHLRWLQPTTDHPLRADVWEEFNDVLKIHVWEYSRYADPSDACPAIVPFDLVVCQVGRMTVRKQKGSQEKLWVTISLDKHGTAL